MRYLAIGIIAGVILSSGIAEGARRMSMQYNGISCSAGKTPKGEASIACRPIDGTGYGVTMSKGYFLLNHNGYILLVKKNK